MFQKVLILAVLLLVCLSTVVASGCDNKNGQVVLLVHNTGKHSNRLFPKFGAVLQSHFIGSQFSVATYSRKKCFQTILKFTTNPLDVVNLRVSGRGDSPISSLIKGIEMASSSHNVKWFDDKDALKLLIVVVAENPEGNNDCGSTPSASSVANQLKQLNIKLVLLHEDRLHDSQLEAFAAKLVQKNVHIHQLPFAAGNPATVLDAMVMLSEAHCEVTPAPAPSEDGTCDKEELEIPKLQIAFIVDRTVTFKAFFKQFADLSRILIKRLKKRFPGSEFAMTTFADYTSTQMLDIKGNNTDTRFGCYKPNQVLTSHADAIADAAFQVSTLFGGGDHVENALVGLFLTIVDTSLGWSKKSTDRDGHPIQKIVILLTDEDTKTAKYNLKFKGTKNRRKPIGDGTDNCENSLIPTFEHVGEEIRKRSFIPLVFTHRNFTRVWEDHFYMKMRINNAQISELDLTNTVDLIKKIENVVTITILCTWEMDEPGMNTYGL